MLRTGTNGEHLGRQQCVRNNVSSFARAFNLKLEGNFFRCVRARSFARVNDAKIMRSGDAQCNNEESR